MNSDFSPAPEAVRRILVFRLRFMGDILLTTPLLDDLRAAYPDAHIAYLTEARFAPLLEHHPALDEVIPLRLHPVRAQLADLARLRAARFDLVLDLFGNPRTAILTRLTGARWRVGGAFRGRGRMYNLQVPLPDGKPDAIAFHQRSLARIGIAPTSRETQVVVTPSELNRARQTLRDAGIDGSVPFVVLHPGASWPNKHWPAAHFRRLTELLAGAGLPVWISSGPGEEAASAKIAAGLGANVVAGGVLPLRDIAALLKLSSAAVANDCGTMHLAVAVGTPTIGIFGPGEPEIWFPYPSERGHSAFWSDISCRPCHKDTCPFGHLQCMHDTSPEMVFRAVESRVAARHPAGEAGE